ncbi:16979_t:CDS:2 [Dentiscutata erythropus]|uniref:16979_t:CDS:1 n=1 Tax=Dentiscutata erythropus TaxID=1348616 RepID=A0A9N9DT13_9GLOM|nr:16979_t:CDS:2 [Dentiscutata erythropus]
MSTGNEAFDNAAQDFEKIVTQHSSSISNEEQLAGYGLFKQSTVGDINTSKPNILDQKGRAKWDAWNSRKGLSKEEAQSQYVDLIAQYKEKYPI